MSQAPTGTNEGISAPFIRYPIGTSLMMAGILFVGLVAYPLLPVAPLPQVDFPTIQITATLPGASPETMASSVAQPLERQFAQIPGIAQMTSTSYLGTAAVTIQFDLNRNIDGAANDVQGGINAAGGQLPKNLPRLRPIARSIRRIRRSCCCRRIGQPAADRRSATPSTPSSPSRSARFPAWRRSRSAASRSHRSGSRSIRRSWSPRACRWRMSATRFSHDGRQPEGQYRRRDARLHDLRQRPDAGFQGLERRHRRLPQRRPLAGSRHRQGRHRARGCQAGGLGQRQARRVPGGLQAARRQRHRHRGQDQGAAAAAGGAIPPAIKIEVISDRTQTIRAAVEDVQFTCC
jgi:HAE1 family hydrophobic/amphiphilic exporter-1